MATPKPADQGTGVETSHILNIVTINLNKMGAIKKKDDRQKSCGYLEEYLRKQRVDIALLQEVSEAWRRYDFREYNKATKSSMRENYLMTLTRRGILNVSKPRVLIDISQCYARVLATTVTFNDELFTVYNVHVMKADVGAQKLFDALSQKTKAGDKVIVGGDFNSVDREEDRFWPMGTTPKVTKGSDLLHDIYPRGSQSMFTFQNARLDRLYVSSCLVGRLASPQTLTDYTTTHKGVMFTIAQNPLPCGSCDAVINSGESVKRCIKCFKNCHVTCGKLSEIGIGRCKIVVYRCAVCEEPNKIKEHDTQTREALKKALQTTCPVCGNQVKENSAGQVKCSDSCKRSFHRICVKENEATDNQRSTWWCRRNDCVTILNIVELIDEQQAEPHKLSEGQASHQKTRQVQNIFEENDTPPVGDRSKTPVEATELPIERKFDSVADTISRKDSTTTPTSSIDTSYDSEVAFASSAQHAGKKLLNMQDSPSSYWETDVPYASAKLPPWSGGQCNCVKTSCSTMLCGCRKSGIGCSPLCHCRGVTCFNPDSKPTTEALRLFGSLPKIEPLPSLGQCRCVATSCSTMQCGCRKSGRSCSGSCHCRGVACYNPATAETFEETTSLEASRDRYTPFTTDIDHGAKKKLSDASDFYDSDEETDTPYASAKLPPPPWSGGQCNCVKTSCSTMHCGCRKSGIGCSPLCHCRGVTCRNPDTKPTPEALRLFGSLPKIEPLPSLGQCRCVATSCSTMQCGCRKSGRSCSGSCHCRGVACYNPATAGSRG
ncbi:uncharacterized protein LOC117640274 [Thrips palmi]|uniref:Uncharacterized protein LOC117640274 n=1 Tax=Thrips palmi TaxID=161013 RepID=A0A6P8Y7D8_THRPL|nr:uncharacterized protein LOC117640274 [Thrips palmi]